MKIEAMRVHMTANKKDVSSKRGLNGMVTKRRKLLKVRGVSFESATRGDGGTLPPSLGRCLSDQGSFVEARAGGMRISVDGQRLTSPFVPPCPRALPRST